jgi:dephospho-CoA kinase
LTFLVKYHNFNKEGGLMSSENGRLILAAVGHPLGGKDTFGEILRDKYNFTFISTGDYLRDYIRVNRICDGKLDRVAMNRLSTQLRLRFGAAFPIPKILEESDPHSNLVLGGLRTVAEGEAVKKFGGKLIAVTCPIKIRYERARARGRIGDKVSFEAFKAIEEKESESDDITAHNVKALIDMARIHIDNNSTLDNFTRRIDLVMSSVMSWLSVK